jgi:DNA-binding response OmpR family regulator
MQVFQRDPADRLSTLPTLDEYGLLRQGATWVALSPIEARLIEAFLSRPGRVLGRNTLAHAGWPNGVPNARSVDSRIKALRKRVAPLALRIHTVRGHGYLADFNAPT